jgi:hypothetical protein
MFIIIILIKICFYYVDLWNSVRRVNVGIARRQLGRLIPWSISVSVSGRSTSGDAVRILVRDRDPGSVADVDGGSQIAAAAAFHCCRKKVSRGKQRPVLISPPGVNFDPRVNFGPQGWSWLPGLKFAPQGEVRPQGWSWPPGGEVGPMGEVGLQGWALSHCRGVKIVCLPLHLLKIEEERATP